MKVCTTCGQEWDTSAITCPDDGGVLSSVAEHAIPTALSNSSGQRVALQPAPAPVPDDLDRDELPAGMQVGEYQIERKIGVGGMGVVYGAKHPLIGKRAAVKVLNARLSMDREAVSRFVLEAQAVNQIGHANIVDIFSFGTLEDGRSYFVMEWLQGETLGERLDRLGKLPVREALTILVALCRALEAAHAAGVIHRDLKPDNVFLATDDDGWRVKLLDFGIAKLSTTAPSISRTATGMVVGTPLFMAPEQAKGEPVDGSTDVYALGLLAYTAVCGTSLFESESSAIEVLAAHISKEPPPPRSLRPDLPVELDVLVLEMLAKRPSFRPSLVDVRQQLAALAATLGAQTGPVPLAEPPRFTVRAQSNVDGVVAVSPKGPTELLAVGGEEPLVPAARGARWPLLLGAVGALGLAAAVFAIMTRGAAPDAVTPPAKLAAAPIPTLPPVTPDAALVTAVAPDAAVPAPVAAVDTAVDITVKPVDAVLTIDGEAAPSPAGHAQLPLAPGSHVAVVTAGGRTVTRPFVVAAGTPLALVVTIAAPPLPGPSHKPPPVSVRPVKPVPPKPVDVDGVANPFAK